MGDTVMDSREGVPGLKGAAVTAETPPPSTRPEDPTFTAATLPWEFLVLLVLVLVVQKVLSLA